MMIPLQSAPRGSGASEVKTIRWSGEPTASKVPFTISAGLGHSKKFSRVSCVSPSRLWANRTIVPGSMVRVVPPGTMTSPMTCTMPDHVSSPARVPDLIIVGASVGTGVLVEVAVGKGVCVTVGLGVEVAVGEGVCIAVRLGAAVGVGRGVTVGVVVAIGLQAVNEAATSISNPNLLMLSSLSTDQKRQLSSGQFSVLRTFCDHAPPNDLRITRPHPHKSA